MIQSDTGLMYMRSAACFVLPIFIGALFFERSFDFNWLKN